MLDRIRRNVRHPYIQVLLGMVILVFILFFGWSMSSQKPTYVAKVNGDSIDYRAYQQAYNGLMRIYQEAFGNTLSPEKMREMELGRRALDQLIDQTLLMQEARRRSLKATDEDLEAAIQAVPVFQDQGRFDKKRYLQVLENNRITPLEFEQSKRQELLLGKVEQSIRAEATVTDAEVKKEYEARNTKIDLEFVTFDPAALRGAVKPAEKDLQDYYEANKESFRTAEKRVARYVLFRPEPHLSKVAATPDDVQKEYNLRLDQFTVKETVRAQHILFRVPPDATPDEVAKIREKAEAVRKEIQGGKDFAAMAKKYSEDPGSKDRGGELGYFQRGQMVPEFDSAAFSLKAGEVSEPVKTAFGFHLIRVEDRREPRQKPLEEVRGELEAELKRRKALEAAYSEADNVLMALEDKKETWDSLAKELSVSTAAPVARDGAVEGVSKGREFVEMLFSLDPAKAGNLLETEQGTYLIAVAQTIPASIPALDQIRAEVEARVREAQAKKLAEQKAGEFLEAAKKNGWDAAVKAGGAKVETTGPFPEKGGQIPKIGGSPELRDAALALKNVQELAPKPFETGGKYYAFRLRSKTPADPAGFEADKEKLKGELLPVKEEEKLQETLKRLRGEAKIKINEELLI